MFTREQILAELARRQSSGGFTPEQIKAELARRGKSGVERFQDAGANAINSVVEPVMTMASGAVAEPLAGLAGIVQGLNPFAPEGAANKAVQGTREALTFQPKTDAGRQGLQAVGNVVEPVVTALTDAESYLGDGAYDATGSPLLAATAASVPSGALELAGVGSGKRALTSVKNSSALKNKLLTQIKEGSGDKSLVKYYVDGAGNLKRDALAQQVIKQGFDEAVIQSVKAATPIDRAKMGKMVAIAKKSKQDALYGMKNRPSDIAGDSLLERFKHVSMVNRSAGESLDGIAKSLKGRPVDFSRPIDNFLKSLDDMGINLDEGLKPKFAGSDVEGLSGPESVVKNIVKRMASGKRGEMPTGYDLHRLKKYIDENVDFGESGEGLKGKTQRILKKLRHDLDEALDSNFPEYDRVNTTYSETIDAINSLQAVAGKKMNLTGTNADKAVGTLLRRLMGNAQSRVNLVDSVDLLDSVGKKYGGKFKDNVSVQMLFADELDNVFGPSTRTSFKAEIGKEITRGLTQPTASASVNAVANGTSKVAGLLKKRKINEAKAFKYIEMLLKRK